MSKFFVSYNKLQGKLIEDEQKEIIEPDPIKHSDIDNFFIAFIKYIVSRLQSFVKYIYYGFFKFVDSVSEIKEYFVKNMFWGRSKLYKFGVQGVIFVFTILIALFNVTSAISSASAKENNDPIISAYINDGLVKEQNNLASLADINSRKIISVETETYQVQAGDTLDAIARKMTQKYIDMYKDIINVQVSEDMIKAKRDVIRYANNLIYENPVLTPGQNLEIYHFDGMIYKVQTGDTVESIATKFKVDKQDIIQINEFDQVGDIDPVMIVGSTILLPRPYIEAGKPTPIVSSSKSSSKKSTITNIKNTNIQIQTQTQTAQVVAGAGGFPLDLSCPHGLSRGLQYSSSGIMTHDGVDIWSHVIGCKELALWSGTVIYTGYKCSSCGNTVIVQYDNGIQGTIYHGNGTYYVKAGDRVVAGQALQGLGSTGNSTGPHLHLTLKKNGVVLNPLNYFTWQ